MTPEDAFLIDILAHPDDATPRLVYADWLEDQADPRAGWIRRGCAVLAHPVGSSERRAARRSLRASLDQEGHTWPEIDGLVLTWDGLVGVIRYRLAEVFAWCSGRGLPLRSRLLHPGDVFDRFAANVAWAAAQPLDAVNWGALVQGVSLRRSQALAEQGRSPRALAEDTGGGRLVIYLPNVGRWEQRAARSGTEYLDDGHIPAWDTWLAYGREPPPDSSHPSAEDYIVAWVPGHLVGDVQAAINSGARRCLCWSEDFDRPFLRRLRAAGLIG